jgi:hypothetical protein
MLRVPATHHEGLSELVDYVTRSAAVHTISSKLYLPYLHINLNHTPSHALVTPLLASGNGVSLGYLQFFISSLIGFSILVVVAFGRCLFEELQRQQHIAP